MTETASPTLDQTAFSSTDIINGGEHTTVNVFLRQLAHGVAAYEHAAIRNGQWECTSGVHALVQCMCLPDPSLGIKEPTVQPDEYAALGKLINILSQAVRVYRDQAVEPGHPDEVIVTTIAEPNSLTAQLATFALSAEGWRLSIVPSRPPNWHWHITVVAAKPQ